MMQSFVPPSPSDLLSAEELANVVGIRPYLIERMVRLELISPATARPQRAFTPSVVPQVRKLVRLHYQLEVSWSSMGLVLELLKRIDDLESRLNDAT